MCRGCAADVIGFHDAAAALHNDAASTQAGSLCRCGETSCVKKPGRIPSWMRRTPCKRDKFQMAVLASRSKYALTSRFDTWAELTLCPPVSSLAVLRGAASA